MADWKADLAQHFDQEQQKKQEDQATAETNSEKTKHFIATVVVPAFEEVKAELEKLGKSAQVYADANSASIYISWGKPDPITHRYTDDLKYYIKVRRGVFPYPEMVYHDRGQRYRAGDFLRGGGNDYTLEQVTKEDIIKHLTNEIKNRSKSE